MTHVAMATTLVRNPPPDVSVMTAVIMMLVVRNPPPDVSVMTAVIMMVVVKNPRLRVL